MTNVARGGGPPVWLSLQQLKASLSSPFRWLYAAAGAYRGSVSVILTSLPSCCTNGPLLSMIGFPCCLETKVLHPPQPSTQHFLLNPLFLPPDFSCCRGNYRVSVPVNGPATPITPCRKYPSPCYQTPIMCPPSSVEVFSPSHQLLQDTGNSFRMEVDQVDCTGPCDC